MRTEARLSDDSTVIAAAFERYFDFLTSKYGFQIISERREDIYVKTLRNSFVQIELASNLHQTYFHAEIRRLINGEVIPYRDRTNNVGFEELAMLALGRQYDHFDFYPSSRDWTSVLQKTADVFKASKEVFTTGEWVDTQRIREIEDQNFFEAFGIKRNANPELSFLERVTQHLLLEDREYRLIFDASDLPPYDSKSNTQCVVFERTSSRLKISQRDWRDDHTIFFLEVDGAEVFEIDISTFDTNEDAAKAFLARMRALIKD